MFLIRLVVNWVVNGETLSQSLVIPIFVKGKLHCQARHSLNSTAGNMPTVAQQLGMIHSIDSIGSSNPNMTNWDRFQVPFVAVKTSWHLSKVKFQG